MWYNIRVLMADIYGKELAGHRYHILYRIINCLDCTYPLHSDPNPKPVTLYYSASPINKEIRHCIKLL